MADAATVRACLRRFGLQHVSNAVKWGCDRKRNDVPSKSQNDFKFIMFTVQRQWSLGLYVWSCNAVTFGGGVDEEMEKYFSPRKDEEKRNLESKCRGLGFFP